MTRSWSINWGRREPQERYAKEMASFIGGEIKPAA
ncbi:hypothetical protein JOC47_003000 [Halanaerobacter jeridensis]|uniref:Uncharacterized protein n=1 Tax=Halanaerobacter jeridensis TaxID=706427 RepID=A0A938XV74_9FIRM|nr:hypothetical protein [Halanaerobacter jeridensis]